jgi:hypothetical protein
MHVELGAEHEVEGKLGNEFTQLGALKLFPKCFENMEVYKVSDFTTIF